MNIVMELALIFGVCLVGVIVASIMPFAVPYSVISLLILMTLLYQKAIKPYQIEKASRFFIENMGIFFVPAVVGTMEYVETLKNYLLPFFGHYACDNAADLFCDGVDCSADAAP